MSVRTRVWNRIVALFSPRFRRMRVVQQQSDIQQVKRIQAYQAARINVLRQEAGVYARGRRYVERDHH